MYYACATPVGFENLPLRLLRSHRHLKNVGHGGISSNLTNELSKKEKLVLKLTSQVSLKNYFQQNK